MSDVLTDFAVPNPAVVQDAQRYDPREDLDQICDVVDCMTNTRDGRARKRLAAHIERLEDLLNGYRSLYDDTCDEYVSLKAERDALLAEHEAVAEYGASLRDSACKTQRRKMLAAHDNAERVIRG